MYRLALSFLVFYVSSVMSSEFDTIHKRGWIPLTREDALNRFRNPGLREYSTAESTQNMQILRENAIAVVTPEKHRVRTINFVPENAAKRQVKINRCEFGICPPNVKHNYEANFSSENELTSKNISLQNEVNKNIRKPKAIEASTLEENDLSDVQDNVNLENKLGKSNLEQLEKDVENVENNEQESRHTYEVNENKENLPIILEQIQQNTKSSGYEYESPKNYNVLLKTNLTNILLSILNKYNIKPEDGSKNYILSRIKGNIPKQNYMLIPIPVRVSRGYNSLNHAPVDPLTAVFLSNYGYYLPSYYGVHNNYRNLYGYLASNNIHNNLPFGPYKIFSDTDSSL